MKQLHKQSDVHKHIRQQVAAYKRAMTLRLQQAGEQFVNIARDKTAMEGGFNDVTGNLRSSIGYIITYEGRVIHRDFRGTGEGTSKGEQLAMREAPLRGFALIGVAGMDYASKVESKGKDVITGSSQLVEIWLKQAVNALKDKL